jgi:hypothetical protein
MHMSSTRIITAGFVLLIAAAAIAAMMYSAPETSPEDGTSTKQREAPAEMASDNAIFPEGTFDLPAGVPAVVTATKIERSHMPIVASILRHALTSDDNADTVRFYGQESNQVLLKSFGSPYEWPADFQPTIEGFQFQRSRDDIPTETALGVDLRQYGPITEDDDSLFYFGAAEGDWKVVLVIYNAKGGGIIGGQRTYYRFDPNSTEFRFCGAMD